MKNHGFNLLVDPLCTIPCTASVEGVSDDIVQGVRYTIDGTEQELNQDWWNDYAITLPDNIIGQVEVEAELIGQWGFAIASDKATFMVFPNQDGNDVITRTSEQFSVRLTNGGQCTNPCTLSADVEGPVERVAFYAGQYLLGEATARDNFELTYQFSQTGQRTIQASALDATGAVRGEHRKLIDIQPQRRQETETRSTVPYFNQFNNALYPGSTCQNTSIAMVLGYLGWRGIPDDLTRSHGKRMAQNPAGLASLFNIYADQNGLSKRLTPVTNGSLSGLKSALDQGHPVIIHGFFTSYGHVLVVLDYDANGYFVNDPAGRWSEVFKGGYTSYGSGKGVYYSKRAFEAAVATSNGYSPLALWYHVLN